MKRNAVAYSTLIFKGACISFQSPSLFAFGILLRVIAKQYVQNNYNRDISMDEVAEMVSMSYSYFSRVFKEQLHQSFSEYVLSVRMREAKRLMEEDPAIKIKEVAELVGYESVYTFSRAYKQYYHVSPKQDRDG